MLLALAGMAIAEALREELGAEERHVLLSTLISPAARATRSSQRTLRLFAGEIRAFLACELDAAHARRRDRLGRWFLTITAEVSRLVILSSATT